MLKKHTLFLHRDCLPSLHLCRGLKSAARLLPDGILCCRLLRAGTGPACSEKGRLKSNDAKAVGIHLKCDQSSLSKERINFVHDNSLKG